MILHSLMLKQTFLDDIDYDIVTFFSDGMGPVTIDLDNINLDDGNFDDDDDDDDDDHHPETIVLIRLIAWCNRYKQRQTCKKR